MSNKKTAGENQRHLPAEIVSYIFRFLPLVDIRSAALVCKLWSSAADDPLLWKNVTAVLYSKTQFFSPYLVDSLQRKKIDSVRFRCQCSPEQILQVCKQLGASLQRVCIQGCRSVTEDLIMKLIQSCRNLSKLDLSKCRQLKVGEKTCGWIEKTGSCVELQEFNISSCKELTDDTVKNIARYITSIRKLGLSSCKGVSLMTWQLLVSKLPYLMSLDLSRSDVSDEVLLKFAQIPSLGLREVSLSACKQLSDNGIVGLVKYQTKLKALRLACLDLTSTSIVAIDKYLQGLTILDLNSCRQITDGGLVKCQNLLKNLESLNLYSCYQISPRGLNKFLEHGAWDLDTPPLRSLILNGCSLLSDAVITKLSKSLLKLQELDISSCLHITNKGLKQIADSLVELRMLKMSWCANITDNGLIGLDNTSGKKTEGLANLRQLRSLDISHCTSITDKGIESIYSLKHLTSLNIDMCVKVSDTTLVGLSSKLPWLEILSLSGCAAVTDKGLMAVACGLPHLILLDISKCDGITDHSIIKLAQHAKHLTHLDMSMCSNVSSKAIRKLESALPGMVSLQLRYSGAQVHMI